MLALCSKLAYYAGIMLNALACLLCLKLCRHNRRRPTYWWHVKARHHQAICVCYIRAVQNDESADSDDTCAISYLTDEMKWDIQELPSLSCITTWMKGLAGMLAEFTFMNLLIYSYSVNGRAKTFEMQSIKAFRSLKTQFCDGFVRNVWVYECTTTSNLI